MKKKKDGADLWEKGFNQGYTLACANMMRDHNEPVMVEDCLKANMLQVAEMKKHGVDPSDIEILKPIIKEINRKDKL